MSRLTPKHGELGASRTASHRLAALATTWRNPHSRRLALGAVGCLLAGLVVTVFVHFSINDDLATWQSEAPLADWRELRDRWLVAHGIRAACVAAALALLTTRRISTAAEPPLNRRCDKQRSA